MSISTTIRRAGPFTGNGSTTAFPFTFKVFVDTDLQVVQADLLGVEEVLVLDSDYAVTLNADQDANPGGTVTLSSALTDGYTLVVVSGVPQTQLVVLTNMGAFFPVIVNKAFDRLTILVQQLQEQIDRSIKLPLTAETGDFELPLPEANQLLAWNGSADGLVTVDPAGLATVSGYGDARVELFEGDGETISFALAFSPGVVGNLDIAVDGVVQVAGVDFDFSGSTLVFTEAPPEETVIHVRYTRPLTPVPNFDAVLASVEAAALSAANANAGAVATAADRIQTGLDRAATETAAATATAGQELLLGLINEVDLQADRGRPLFVPLSLFTKSYRTVAPVETITVASRDSASVFTVASGKGSKLAAGGACVVYDGTADRYYSFGIKSIATDTVTVHGTLPSVCTTVETMHEAYGGQHLGRHGYNGVGEFLAGQQEKYAYRKDQRLFTFHPPFCKNGALYYDPNVYDRATGLTTLIEVTPLGGAQGGGTVAGTTGLEKLCGPLGADHSSATVPLGQIMPRYYIVQDGVAGRGMEFSFDAGGVDGFIQIAIGAAREVYDSTFRTEGSVRLEVEADGETLHDETFPAGIVNLVNVEHEAASSITIRMTQTQSVPTSARLHYVYSYQKSPATPTTGLFEDGDVVGFIGDSWTQYPAPIGGETPPLRPDGSPGEGMQFMSERLRTVLADDGITIETYNFGKGGVTSAYCRYWLPELLADYPRINKWVLNSSINDGNSITNPASTAYDFDPDDKWSFLPVGSGGVSGKIASWSEWEDNLQAMSSAILAAGKTPIILMPPDTGSNFQCYPMQRDGLARLAAGFSTPAA